MLSVILSQRFAEGSLLYPVPGEALDRAVQDAVENGLVRRLPCGGYVPTKRGRQVRLAFEREKSRSVFRR